MGRTLACRIQNDWLIRKFSIILARLKKAHSGCGAGTLPMVDKYKFTWTEWNALLRDVKHLLVSGNEREFMQILRDHGIKDEDPRFAEILKLFREIRRGKA